VNAVNWLLLNQSKGYWIAFLVAFFAAAVAESLRPARVITGVEKRWARHGALFVVGTVAVGVVLRFSPVAVALAFSDSPHGLLNRLPFWPAFVLTILALDLVHYVTHWTYHHVGWLWKVHSVHHSDVDYDVSTAVRFHPIEYLLGGGSTLAAIALLAAPPIAVLVSELITVVTNLAVHANANYPPALERVLRTVFVTPAIHRIHHAEDFGDQNANYGQSLVIWDRLFATFRARAASQNFATGLEESRGCDTLSIHHLLTAPFRRSK